MFFDGRPRPRWERVPVAQAAESYDLMEISQDSVELEDLYGEEPEFLFVHVGDVAVAGPLLVHDNDSDENGTLYVIDGDLTVDGPATFQNWDANTALYVTGAVTVRDLTCVSHGQLFVGGPLTVESLLFTDLADAGHLVVHGPVSTRVWIEAAGRGAVYFPDVPRARLIGGPGNPYFGDATTVETIEEAVLPEFHDRSKLMRAVLDHLPVLR